MPDNPHPQYMQDRCEWCAQGWPYWGHTRTHINHGMCKRCTAPTANERISELEAELAATKAVLERTWRHLRTENEYTSEDHEHYHETLRLMHEILAIDAARSKQA